MPVIRLDTFKGMLPRADPHLLPNGLATAAINTDLVSGVLEPYKAGFKLLTTVLGIKTLFRYGDKWLAWTKDVSVVPSMLANDPAESVYWTGDGTPKQSDAATLAIAGDFVVDPTAADPLGVPAPEEAPIATVAGSGPDEIDVRTYVYAWTRGAVIGGKSDPLSVAVGRDQAVKLEGLDDTPPATFNGAAAKPQSFRKAIFLVDAEAGQYILLTRLTYGATEYEDQGKTTKRRYKATAFKAGKIAAPASPAHVIADPCDVTTGWTVAGGWSHGTGEFIHTAGTAGDLSRAVTGLTPGNQYVIYADTTSASVGTLDIKLDAAALVTNIGDNQRQVVQFTASAASHAVVLSASSDYDGHLTYLGIDDATSISAVAIPAQQTASPTTRQYVYCWTYILNGLTYRTDASFAAAVDNVQETDTVVISGMATDPAGTFPAGAKGIRKRLFRLDHGKPPVYRQVALLRRRQTAFNDKKRTRQLGSKLTRFPVGLAGSPSAPVVALKPWNDSGDATEQQSRYYVYTYVNSRGQESAPSPRTDDVVVWPWEAVTLTTPTTPPAGYSNITVKRFYRTDATGELRLLFESVPIGTASVDDSVDTIDLGDPLESTDWDTPPADLFGLLAMPNVGMVGFSGKQVCPSEKDVPYAYPVGYRKSTPYPIVGGVATDVGVVVVTTAFPYLLTGTDPAALSLDRINCFQGCVAAQSVVDMGHMVIYASAEGLVGVQGGSAALLTADTILPEQWQGYAPDTMRAYRYQGRYVAFFDAGSLDGALIFDPDEKTLVRVTVLASAGFSDQEDGQLYVQIGADLCQWAAGDPLTQQWRSGEIMMDVRQCPVAGRIEASAYPVTFHLWTDGILRYAATVNDARAFRLPSGYRANRFQAEVLGATTIRRISLAPTMAELAQ